MGRGVDPDHGDLVVLVKRLELVVEVASVGFVGAEEAGLEIEKRDVVVAGNHEFAPGRLVEVSTRFRELAGTRPLGEIAAYDNQIRRFLPSKSRERVERGSLRSVKMQALQVDKFLYVKLSPSLGSWIEIIKRAQIGIKT